MTHFYFNTFEKNSAYKLRNSLRDTLDQNGVLEEDIVILCIGTDRATGDCLGPLVGEHLMQVLPHIPIYGNLESPIHALNLEETILHIHSCLLYTSPSPRD